MTRVARRFFAFTILALGFPHVAHSAPTYVVLDLGTLGGAFGQANAINASGQVAGHAYLADNSAFHAFRTTPATVINPATDDLGYVTTAASNRYAYGINTSGQTAGYINPLSAGSTRAFRGSAGAVATLTDLGTLGGTNAFGAAINDAGQVAGYSNTAAGDVHAFRTAANANINSTTDDLGTLGGSTSRAMGINSLGETVGHSLLADGTTHAFRSSATGSAIALADLGGLGGNLSRARAINESGLVVGEANISTNGPIHAFRTGARSAITKATDDLGVLPTGDTSSAYGINARGDVVGTANKGEPGQPYIPALAFLYTDGAMYDLNTLVINGTGWTLQYAYGINDSGQIVGAGTINGQTHAFLLTPTPEPGSLGLCVAAVGMFLCRRRGARTLH